MRHFISLGVRGVLLEIGGLLMRVQGGLFYRGLVRRRATLNPRYQQRLGPFDSSGHF